MIVTFCGHNEITQSDELKKWLIDITRELIEEGSTKFYFGGYGKFDSLAATVITNHKLTYLNLERILVIPYINHAYNNFLYDCSIYPDLETIPRKLAILKRNEWMIDNSDVVIAYVTHDWGGAAKTLKYAKKRKKNIFLFSSII